MIHHLLRDRTHDLPSCSSLFTELKDHFRPSFDRAPDHLRDKNLVGSQLPFPSGDNQRQTSSSIWIERYPGGTHTQGYGESHRYPADSSAHHLFQLLLEMFGPSWLFSVEMRAHSGHSESDLEALTSDLSVLKKTKQNCFQF